MVREWALSEIKDFEDVAEAFSRGRDSFDFSVGLVAHGPSESECALFVSYEGFSLIHDVMVKIADAENWSLAGDYEQFAQSLGEGLSWVCAKHATTIAPVIESRFEKGKAYYERNKDSLTREFSGEYIAIWDDEVLDHDMSFSSLAERVYTKLGYVSVYMPFVTSKQRVLRFESPERRSANVS